MRLTVMAEPGPFTVTTSPNLASSDSDCFAGSEQAGYLQLQASLLSPPLSVQSPEHAPGRYLKCFITEHPYY